MVSFAKMNNCELEPMHQLVLKGFKRNFETITRLSTFLWILFFVSALAIPLLWSAEDYGAWTHSTTIRFNTTENGADIRSDLYNFPVLIRLNNTKLDFTQAQSNGEDIRFTKSDNTQISYEIERWDAISELAEIWVLIDTVYGNGDSQTIKMYWGKSDAVDSSNGADVFETAMNFTGVWHLNEDGNNNNPGYFDATSNHNDGQGNSMETTSDVSGIIGIAQDFDGTSDYIEVPDDTTLKPINITVSAWIKPDTWEKIFESIVSKEKSDNPWPSFDFRRDNNSNAIQVHLAEDSEQGYALANNVVTGTWQHVAFTYDGETILIYQNGIQTGSNTAPSGELAPTSSVLRIAANSYMSTREFDGVIDEVRISSIPRSADWIKACFENQREYQTLICIGAGCGVQTPPVVGWNPDETPPTFLAEQEQDGSKRIRLSFKVQDSQADSILLSNFQYSLDSGNTWISEPDSSAALDSGWHTQAFASHTVMDEAASHIIHFHTAHSQAGHFDENVTDFVIVRFGYSETDGTFSDIAYSNGFRVDTKPPNITFAAVATSDKTPPLAGTTNEKISEASIIINEETYMANLTSDSLGWNIPDNTLSELTDGIHVITISVKDLQGNTATRAFDESIQIDPESPTITVNALYTAELSPQITGTVSDTLASVQVTIGTETYPAKVELDGTWRIQAGIYKNLSPGTYNIIATAESNSGSIGTDPTTNELKIADIPIITIFPLTTSSLSPALSGWVSDLEAVVNVTIGEETHEAIVAQNNIWRIQVGTFTPLEDGTYDIVVNARNSAGGASDTTTNELTIRSTPPNITIEGFITNNARPSLNGDVEPFIESIAVEFFREEDGNLIVFQTAIPSNLKNGRWILPSSGIEALPEDTLTVIVTATDDNGLSGHDTTLVIIDQTSPVVTSLTPSNKSYTTEAVAFSITFNEPVQLFQGEITLKEIGNDEAVAVFQAEGSDITQTGPAKFDFSSDILLNNNTEYHVLIGEQAFRDKARNYYGGLQSDSGWTFRVAGDDVPFIDSVTSETENGLFGIGSEIKMELHFSQPITLAGGQLVVELASGNTPGQIAFDPFENAKSVVGTYIVQMGDSTDALALSGELKLVDGATAISSENGNPLILNLGKEKFISNRSAIRLDGKPPIIRAFSPLSSANVNVLEIKWTLDETVTTLNLSWHHCKIEGEDCASHTLVLNEAFFESGSHEFKMDSDGFTSGATYSVTLAATDSAGNDFSVVSDMVKLLSTITALRLTPGDTTVKVESRWMIDAIGLSSLDAETGIKLKDVEWSSTGPCGIKNGQIEAFGLGQCRVTGRSDSLEATIIIGVNQAIGTFSSTGDELIPLGKGIEIRIPKLSNAKDTTFKISQLESARLPEGMTPVGSTPFVFEPNEADTTWAFDESATLRILLNDTSLSEGDRSKVQVYRTLPGQDGSWHRLPSSLKDNWIETITDTLGGFLTAIDYVPPEFSEIELKTEAEAGESLQISFKIKDNIANPDGNLHVYLGGGQRDSLFVASFANGTYRASIPKSWITSAGLWYILRADDGVNQTLSDTTDIKVEVSENLVVGIKEGYYQMFSIPLLPEDNLAKDLLFDDLGAKDNNKWRLYSYNSRQSKFEETKPDREVSPGTVYWIHTNDFTPSIDMDKGAIHTPSVSRPYAIPLETGWNCISIPFLFNIDKSCLRTHGGKAVEKLWTYTKEGNWLTIKDIPDIRPWRGYLIWNGKEATTSDSLYIYPGTGSALSKLAAKPGIRISLSVSDGKIHDGMAVIGFGDPTADNGKDSRDHIKPQLFSKPLEISLFTKWDNKTPYLTDIRKELGRGQAWRYTLSIAKNSGRPTLCFTNLDHLPENTGAILLDHTSGTIHPLQKASLPYPGGNQSGTNVFEVAIGTPAYLKEHQKGFLLETTRFELTAITPNPVSRYATIKYSLPLNQAGQHHVRLRLYDIHGRLVRTLAEEYKMPGKHLFSWNLQKTGGLIPNRVYLLILTAGKHEAKEKILVLQ